MQHVSMKFAIGVTVYHYSQIMGDGGDGAIRGDFEVRATGVGPAKTYDDMVGQLPVFTSLKWSHEFETKIRLKGDVGFFTFTIPLGTPFCSIARHTNCSGRIILAEVIYSQLCLGCLRV